VLNRLVAVGCRLVSVPVVLKLLDAERYGLWLMVTSFMGWLAFVDFGIPAGLQNALSGAMAHGDISMGKRLVRYAWFCLIRTSSIVGVVGGLLVFIFPIGSWLGLHGQLNDEFIYTLAVCLGLFIVNLPFKLNVPIAYAINRAEVAPIVELLAQILGLAVILVCVFVKFYSLIALVVATNAVLALLGCISFYWILKRSPWSDYLRADIPSFAERKSVRIQGWLFLFIAIGDGLVLQTDAFLIGGVVGSSNVPRFLIPAMVFINFLQLQNAFLRPLWSKFSGYNALRHYDAAKNLVKRTLLWSMLGAVAFGIGLVICGNWFFKFWTHNAIALPRTMAWGLAAYVLVGSVSNVLALFCNAVGLARKRLLGVISFGVSKCLVALFVLHYSTLEYLPLAYAVCALLTDFSWLMYAAKKYFKHDVSKCII